MTIRLNKVTRDLNVGITTVVEFLQKKGYTIEASPNAKITEEQYAVLVKEFSTDKNLKIESEKFSQERQNKDRNKASISIEGFESKKEKEEVVKTVIPEEARPKLSTRHQPCFLPGPLFLSTSRAEHSIQPWLYPIQYS